MGATTVRQSRFLRDYAPYTIYLSAFVLFCVAPTYWLIALAELRQRGGPVYPEAASQHHRVPLRGAQADILTRRLQPARQIALPFRVHARAGGRRYSALLGRFENL
jgi:hypothetical protein